MTIAADEDIEVWPPAVTLKDVSWDVYQKLLKGVGEANLRLTYSKGALEIMSPLPEHENIKSLIGRFVERLAEEMEIPSRSLGSTTFKRKSLLQGLEPDECFYIQHEAEVRGKKRIDLQRDPPPDLVIEIDISYRTVDKQSIYANIRVPEIWSYDSGRLTCLHLRRGKYERHENSLAFPFLKPAVIEPFVKMLDDSDDSTIGRRWRSWIHKNLPLKKDSR